MSGCTTVSLPARLSRLGQLHSLLSLDDAREGIGGVEWRRTIAHCAPTDSDRQEDHDGGRPRPRGQERRRRHRAGRLVQAFSSPDSYGLVLLLLMVTYTLSATATAGWTASLVLFA